MKWRNFTIEISAALLVILFIYTGMNKLMDHEQFSFQLGRSPYMQHLVDYIAIPLPLGELAIAALLIFKRTRLLGFYASFFLMSLFTGYVWLMLNKSYYLPCSCGGILQALSWKAHLVFNATFTGLSLAGIFLQSNKINHTLKKEVSLQMSM
jgi:hypothetical protein